METRRAKTKKSIFVLKGRKRELKSSVNAIRRTLSFLDTEVLKGLDLPIAKFFIFRHITSRQKRSDTHVKKGFVK